MTDFTKLFVKEMGKGVIELTCAGMVNILKYIPRVRGVDDVVRPCSLEPTPDELKTQKMCKKSVKDDLEALEYVPDHFKAKKMCSSAVRIELCSLAYVPDHFKTQKRCGKAVKDNPSFLQFVSDWFVTQQQLKIWHDDDYYNDGYELIDWYKDCQKRKSQKAQIKKELMPIAWHPSRWWNWCMSEDGKRDAETLWV